MAKKKAGAGGGGGARPNIPTTQGGGRVNGKRVESRQTRPQRARAAAARASSLAESGDYDQAQKVLDRARRLGGGQMGRNFRRDVREARSLIQQGGEPVVTETTTPANGGGDGGGEVTEPAFDQGLARDVARDILKQYGLEDMGIDVDSLVRQYGQNYDLYEVGIRNTEGYKKRFAGLSALRQSGNTYGITTEGEYLQLENQYRNIFRQSGLGSRITGADGSDYAGIADLISKYNVSVDEVAGRVADAQRIVNDTSADVKQALQEFYNIGPNDLLNYALDPANAMAEINRKANAATIAGLGRGAGLGLSQQYAERLATDVFGESDIDREQFQRAVTAASTEQRQVGRLAQLEGGELTGEETLSATLGRDALAEEKISGLRSRERARFSGASAVQRSTLRRRRGV